jgi:hypothetical protein
MLLPVLALTVNTQLVLCCLSCTSAAAGAAAATCVDAAIIGRAVAAAAGAGTHQCTGMLSASAISKPHRAPRMRSTRLPGATAAAADAMLLHRTAVVRLMLRTGSSTTPGSERVCGGGGGGGTAIQHLGRCMDWSIA